MLVNRIVAFGSVFFFGFVVSTFIFRYYLDTKIIQSTSCRHTSMTKAELVEATPMGVLDNDGFPAKCIWKVNGKLETHYMSHCGYKMVGTIEDYPYTSNSCDDLLATFRK
jgi:hypothetical protein